MLKEVELLVASRRPEVVAHVGQGFCLGSSPSSFMTVMLDFFPNGGFFSTMSFATEGFSARRGGSEGKSSACPASAN